MRPLLPQAPRTLALVRAHGVAEGEGEQLPPLQGQVGVWQQGAGEVELVPAL